MGETQFLVAYDIAGRRRIGWLQSSAIDASCEIWGVRDLNGKRSTEWLSLAECDSSCRFLTRSDLAATRSVAWTDESPSVAIYGEEVLADGPIGYWRFNEVSGSVADDAIAANNGTIAAGVTLDVPGALPDDASFRFDGNQGKVSFASPALTGDFTLEAWAYLLGPGAVGSTDYGCVIGLDAAHRFLIRSTTKELLVQMGGGNLTAPADSFQLEQWTHLVYTRTGSTQRLYVNGVLVNTLAQAGASFNAAWFVGSYLSTSTNYSFNGRIDEVAIYNKVLAPDRIAAHYAARPNPALDQPIIETQPASTNAPAALTITTPDASGQVVEPCIEYIPGGWNGHPYWALITGYTNANAATENPCIYYSDDGVTFTPVPGAPFPIDPAPSNGHNADPELRLGPDNKLHAIWMKYDYPVNGTCGVYYSNSADGVTWSAPVALFQTAMGADQPTGPCLLYDADNVRWLMFYVDSHGAGVYPIKRRSCDGTSPAGTWSTALTCTMTGVPGARAPFEPHIERHFDQLHMVVTFCDQGTGGGNTTLHFGVSNDKGYTWNFNPTPFLVASASGWDNGLVYRGDFDHVRDGSGGLYDFWYSGRNTGTTWRFGRTKITI